MSNFISSITWGTKLADTTVTVYFVPYGGLRDGMDSEGFNAYEKSRFEAAFDLISSVSGLEFVITNDPNADFQLMLDTDEIRGDYLGYFAPPGEYGAGVGVFDGSSWDRYAGGDLELGGYGFVTIVHELLHGLGLAHPHDDGGSSAIMQGVTADFDDLGAFDMNQGVYTTMTYNTGYYTGSLGSKVALSGLYGSEAGPMALDIAVLQALYGKGGPHKAGNSTYLIDGENGAGTYWQTIWDTGGIDTLRYDGARDTDIDLRAATLQQGPGGGGYISSAKGIAGGYTIANGVWIENAVGGSGDDDITGNTLGNYLQGRGGIDWISGADGNDRIEGGRGADRMWGDNGSDVILGGSGGDRLWGGGGTDTLKGGSGADILRGGGKADILKGGGGADRLIGGKGADHLVGGWKSDILKGGGGADRLQGGPGADILKGGTGRDVMTGGGGADTFVFTAASQSRNGAGGRDKITDFKRGTDEIDLRSIDADTTRKGNQAFDFIGGSRFGDAGDLKVSKDGGSLILRADRNGDSRPDFEIKLAGLGWIGEADILL